MLMTDHQLAFPESFARLPDVNANVANANANKNWEILGANVAVGALVANGVRAETAGADGDQHIVRPHLDANQSLVQLAQYQPNLHPSWDNIISLAAASAIPQEMASGFKILADFDPVGDDDSIVFDFDGTGNIEVVERRAGATIATVDTGVAVAAGTMYRFRIVFNDQNEAECWIGTGLGDLRLVHTTGAYLSSVTTMKPYFGVEQAEGDPVILGYHKADVTVDPLIVPDA